MKTKTDDTHKDVVPWMLNFEKNKSLLFVSSDQENLTSNFTYVLREVAHLWSYVLV